jgi:[acyl-carrier-protein] S-malonyltransferase
LVAALETYLAAGLEWAALGREPTTFQRRGCEDRELPFRKRGRSLEGWPVKGLTCLFPGSLSVRVGMLEGMEERYAPIRDLLSTASELAGCDLGELIRGGPAEELQADPVATLAAVAADVAMFRVLEAMGIAPVALAGYGSGYYAAVVAAGVIPFSTALEMAAEEQRIGWEILGDQEYGLMEVQGLEARSLEDLLADLVRREAVCLAAQAGPDRITLAGEVGALETALGRLQGNAGSVERLPRRLPRHSPALLGVPERLNAVFGRLTAEDPSIPIYSHFDGSIVLRGWQAKELLINQMIHPVRWDQCIRGLVRSGMDTFIEVGPGRRLSGLLLELEPGANVFDTDRPESLERVREAFSSWAF